MIQEDKELLIKDLCARLPYGVKVYLNTDMNSNWTGDYFLTAIKSQEYSVQCSAKHFSCWCNIKWVKPYLFPISSMTKEQHKAFYNVFPNSMHFSYTTHNELIIYTDPEYDCDHAFESFVEMQDWLNAHHFDYRGLIKRGLAIDATGLGIYKMK